jgi:hypothetical protein
MIKGKNFQNIKKLIITIHRSGVKNSCIYNSQIVRQRIAQIENPKTHTMKIHKNFKMHIEVKETRVHFSSSLKLKKLSIIFFRTTLFAEGKKISEE